MTDLQLQPDSTDQTDAMAVSVRDAILDVVGATHDDVHLGERVGLAQTSVALHFTDAGGVGATLLLDRRPPEAIARILPDAESSIHATTEQWDSFWGGEYPLAMGMARLEVSFTGPVRKFLRVVPILRSLAPVYRQIQVRYALEGGGTSALAGRA